jgi:hypothetical protein
MVKQTAKFASAIFASVLVGAPITTISSSAAVAADDCLTEPGNKTPQGQHWFYRFEHGSRRQCWYLRGEGEGSTQAGSSAKTAVPSRTNETPAPRSVADAYDELPSSRVRGEQDGGASAAPRAPANMPIAANPGDNQNPGAGSSVGASALVDSVPQSLVASRWPEPSTVNSSVNPAPEASATMVADANPTPQAEPSPALAPALPVEAAAPAQKPADSFQMLLLVILGALALASLTGSGVYQFGRARRVVRATASQRDIRQSADPARRPPLADMRPENLAARADVARHLDFAPPRGYSADAQPAPAFANN